MDSNRGFVFQKVTADMHTNSALQCVCPHWPTADYGSAPPEYKRSRASQSYCAYGLSWCRTPEHFTHDFQFHCSLQDRHLYSTCDKPYRRAMVHRWLHGLWIYCKLDGATKRVRSYYVKVRTEFLKLKTELWENGPMHCAVHPPFQVDFMQYAGVLYTVLLL